MKRKVWIVVAVLAVCLMTVLPAAAANVFAFTEKSVSLFEGEKAETAINRDGDWVEGDIVYTSETPKVATVSEDGVITAVSKGRAKIAASLMRNGKRIRSTYIDVTVARRVTKVTLSRKNLVVLEPGDPLLAGLLKPLQEETDPVPADPDSPELPDPQPDEANLLTDPVLVVLAGKSVSLSVTCTPEDASNRKVTFETSDAGIAKIVDGSKIRGVEKGECDLTISSVQNPEIQEVFHVVVIEPVKKVRIEAPDKTMFAGEQMKLETVCTPENASIQKVTWTSKKPSVAAVDENGLVTGLAKGDVTIEARTTDGTNLAATLTIRVMQNVTEVTLKETDVIVSTNRSVRLAATVLPKEANNKKLKWTTSDETIATVKTDGTVTGKKAGICVITCTSESNPAVSASAAVQVVQPVTKISFNPSGPLTFPIQTSQQLYWTVEPEDASIKDVTFRSNHPEIASVDGNGLVTGVKRGEAQIIASATDGSKREGKIKVVVTQPVEGVNLPQQMYYVQRGHGRNIRTEVLPKDANNKRVYWEIGDEYIASVRANGTSTGWVSGHQNGITTVTAITEDGGYTASASVRVADFDGAVMVEGLEITQDNKIRITLRNTSDMVINKVYFHIDCRDLSGNPMVYNKDGVTTGFDGSYPVSRYPYPLYSGERTQHGEFDFGNFMETGLLGEVVLTITGYQFDNGERWEIPAEYRVPSVPARSEIFGTATPTPMPPQNPEGE